MVDLAKSSPMSYRILISVAKVPEFESQFEAKITFQIAKWQGTSRYPAIFDLESDLGIRLLLYIVLRS